MLNVNNELHHIYAKTTAELGENINQLLLDQHNVNIQDFHVGVGDVDEIEYHGEPTEITYDVEVIDGKLTSVTLQCNEIPKLMHGARLDVTDETVALYNNTVDAYEISAMHSIGMHSTK